MVLDWSTPFVTDIFTVGYEETCNSTERPTGYELFKVDWMGLRYTIDRQGLWKLTEECGKICEKVPGFPSVKLGILMGRRICGVP